MVFNSITFLVFFNIFFVLYWKVNQRMAVQWRNALIIIGSYIFYGWWDWRFLALIIASSTADFILGLQIERSEKAARRRLFLGLSIAINLGILGFFKYFNFFIESLSIALGWADIPAHFQTLQIILPVGISFYTFQTLSYTIDVFHKKLKPTKDPLAFFSFVAFFPQLVAGPIERAKYFLPQFYTSKTFQLNKVIEGSRLVLWGLFKKVVIADNVGIMVNHIFFPDASIMTAPLTIIGCVLFAIQIYCDFSGYTDIAIGIARMLGFDLRKNFQTPYFSASLTEFWRRWHISLSTWFRDYVYIPLGGNRKGSIKTYFNIFITFVISGLWHGANWTFVIWGALHGIVLMLEKWLGNQSKRQWSVPFIFILVALFWMPFRAENVHHLLALIHSLGQFSNFSLNAIQPFILIYSDFKMIIFAITLIIFAIIERQINLEDFNEWIQRFSKPSRIGIYYWLLISILLLGNFSVKPDFIYFQF